MNQPDPIIEEHAAPVDEAKASFRRRAIVVSLTFHLLLLLVLLFWYLPKHNQPERSQPLAGQSSTKSDDQAAAKPPPPAPVADVAPEQIEKSVESQIEQVKRLPDERKLSELEKNLKRLNSVASEESVREVTTTIASTLGLDPGQYAPKNAPAEGPFDTDTGQLQDVTRTRDQAGGWKYESVLVDAEGRTITVPMTAAEGETVYNTFQQMKKFPMAEGIYRSVVIPLLQKMIQAEELANKAATEAERLKRQAPSSSENRETDE